MKKKRREPNYKDFQRQGTNVTGLSENEKKLKGELEAYRNNHKKPWYL